MANRGHRRAAANLAELNLPEAHELGPFPRDKILITEPQAAKALSRSVRTLRRWRSSRRPRIPFVKLGSVPAYVLGDLLDVIEKSKVRAA
jgi:hypothetical protein